MSYDFGDSVYIIGPFWVASENDEIKVTLRLQEKAEKKLSDIPIWALALDPTPISNKTIHDGLPELKRYREWLNAKNPKTDEDKSELADVDKLLNVLEESSNG